MKNKSTSIFVVLMTILSVFSFTPGLASADGMMISKPDPYSDRWDYSNESNQQAFINYENGLQKMIISIGIDGENSKEVFWLFPVPASPDKVKIDVAKELPDLSGEEVSKKAKSYMDDTAKILQMSQLYTIPFIFSSQVHDSNYMDNAKGTQGISMRGFSWGAETDVVIYQHLDKEGISSEIITAKTANGLYDYLKSKGLKIENGSIPILNYYIGKDYSFVVSWINPNPIIPNQITAKQIGTNFGYYINNSSRFAELMDSLEQKYPETGQYTGGDYVYFLMSNEGKTALGELVQSIQSDPSILPPELSSFGYGDTAKQRGIFVTFPSKEIYFPLLPTSVYGDKIVPATIRVIGHFTPETFSDIKDYLKTEYYVNGYFWPSENLKNFYDKQYEDIKYTKIEINAPSKLLTQDLFIKAGKPMKTSLAIFLAEYPFISFMTLLIVCSALIGILAGRMVFRDIRNKPIKLALIGLSNCLTIYGLLIATVFTRTKGGDGNIALLLSEMRQKIYIRRRRLAMIIIFIFIALFVYFLFTFSSAIGNSFTISDYTDMFYGVLIYTVVFLLILSLIFRLKRIKAEDKILFEQLKSAGYSSWTFQPKDRMKIVFVPVFSALFLAVSWILVQFLKFIV